MCVYQRRTRVHWQSVSNGSSGRVTYYIPEKCTCSKNHHCSSAERSKLLADKLIHCWGLLVTHSSRAEELSIHSSAPWPSLGLMSTTPPLSSVKFTYFWIMPSPQYPLPWVYTVAGDSSLSSLPETVTTQYWYTLPTLRSLENRKTAISYIDAVQGVGWGETTPAPWVHSVPRSYFCNHIQLSSQLYRLLGRRHSSTHEGWHQNAQQWQRAPAARWPCILLETFLLLN